MICICIPSRGRPQFIERLVSKALDTATDSSTVIIKYYLNDNDSSLPEYVKTLQDLKKKYNNSLQWIIGPDQNTILSWNEIAESVDADYYMLAGDEVIFETKGWDKKFDETKQKYPDGIFCMSIFCGRENRYTTMRCTTPVVTKQWREALGYFWAPMFWHWEVDRWTGELAKAINRFEFRRDITVRIKKMKDTTGMRNRSIGVFKRDEWTYNKCKEIYFDYDVEKLRKAIIN